MKTACLIKFTFLSMFFLCAFYSTTFAQEYTYYCCCNADGSECKNPPAYQNGYCCPVEYGYSTPNCDRNVNPACCENPAQPIISICPSDMILEKK